MGRILRWPILGLTLASLAGGAAVAAPVLPSGGQVAAGSASIGPTSGGSLTITQASKDAIIDWSSFSIGQGGVVAVGNGAGATLNRVTSGGPLSSIDGLLTATGSVFLINSSGVIVGKTGVINVGGSFVASTLDLPDAAFMAGGDLAFSGSSSGAVVNEGKIGALGGDVALIAADVENNGTITAPNGDVGLIAGQQVLMRDQLLDDGKFVVLAGGTGTSASNTGAIAAAEAELRANGGNVYALAGNTQSVIKATGVSSNDGKVFLVAENGGTTTAQGEIDATGQVETSGTSVDFDGLKVVAPSWLVDPVDLIVGSAAASTISMNLGSTSVILQTTSTGSSGPGMQNVNGVGDIDIEAPISWNSANTLTLDAYHGVNIIAPITVQGAGGVVLTTNDGGTGGDDSFGLGPSGFGGSISFTGTPGAGQSLTINGQAYTLLYKLTDSVATTGVGPDDGTDDIAGIDNAGDGGFYALAVNVIGTGTGAASASQAQFAGPLVGAGTNSFAGVFDGLGHTITDLTIYNITSNNVGLFGRSYGLIRDVGLIGGAVAGAGEFASVGELVGLSVSPTGSTTVLNAYATGETLSSGDGAVGGLIGTDDGGSVSNAYDTGVAAGGGAVGGLIGADSAEGIGDTEPSISNAYATGAVSTATDSADAVGGLVGINSGSISNSYATGSFGEPCCGGAMGGLVGDNTTTGAITGSYATGSNDGGGGEVGGLVGQNYGVISSSQASGAIVLGSAVYVGGLAGENLGSITNAYATGSVRGDSKTGGLVGLNVASIADSYATGAVTGGGQGDVGGLVGENGVFTGTISVTNSYATGSVAGGANDIVGGLIGLNGGDPTTISYAYALGAVSGGSGSTVGGLIGSNVALGAASMITISDVYAAGVVSGGSVAGGLVAAQTSPSFISVTDAYWDSQTSGQSSSQGGAPLTTAQFFTASNLAGFTFGTTPGGSGWVIVDTDGSLNNASGAAGGTRPMLLSEYSTIIVNDHQLQLAQLNLSANYALGANVSASDTDGASDPSNLWTAAGFVPIGADYPQTFTGTLNGNGYVISGLTIDRPGVPGAVGLFGYLDGDVSNLGLSGGSITGEGTNYDSGTGVGALAALSNSLITNTWSTASVTGALNNIGGLVGENQGQIIGSSASGAVTIASGASATEVGGLVGENGGSITGSYAGGSVTGSPPTSPFASANYGGLVGANSGTISSSYSTATLNVTAGGVGGLVGLNFYDGSISQSYATGGVTGADPGGLVGANEGSITNSYATGAVTGIASVVDLTDYGAGGLVGANAGTVNQTYATGLVTGAAQNVGGLAGANDFSDSGEPTQGSISNSFWDAGTTGQAEGYGVNIEGASAVTNLVAIGGTTGLSPYAASSYAGLTFAATPGGSGWVIVDDDGTLNNAGDAAGATRPMLLSEYSIEIGNDHQLQLIALDPSATYTITNNIDAADIGAASGIWTSAGFLPVGGANGFAGSLAGDGFAISGLYINDPTASGVGLFTSVAASGSVSNLVLTGVNITGASQVGALAGSNVGIISGSSASGSITGSVTGGYVGGLVGSNGGTLIGDSSSAALSGNAWIGGLAGSNYGTIGGASSASGAVSGGIGLGGLVGDNSGSLTDVSAGTGAVTSTSSFAGGLVGVNESDGTITDASTSGATISASYGAGGLVGVNVGTVSDSSSSDTVSATQKSGGVAGMNVGALTNDAASGSVSGPNQTGGVAGFNGGDITGSSSSATVAGGVSGGYIGGLVGYNTTALTDDSATGQVSGEGWIGGLAGYNSSTISNSSVGNSLVGVTVSGQTGIGGLVGDNFGMLSSDNVRNAVVSATSFGGELVGINEEGSSVSQSATVGGSATATYGAGGLAGLNIGTITDSSAGGYITATQKAGGLVGMNTATLTGDSADATTSSPNQAGGLAGYNSGSIADSSSSGLVGPAVGGNTSVGGYIGGLVGYNEGPLNGDSSTAEVFGEGWIGGLAGYNDSTIEGGSSAGGSQVFGQTGVGGLVGENAGTLQGVSAGTGPVTADTFAGGLVGYNESNGSISQATTSGATVTSSYGGGGLVGLNAGSVSQSVSSDTVNASANGGGLVGLNSGSITDTYTTGAVEAGAQVGGLAGYNNGSIQTSWTGASVAAGSSAGGVVGFNDAGGSLRNVYWNVTQTGQSNPMGAGSIGSLTNVVGVGGATGVSPDAPATYTGFNFSTVWTIDVGVSPPTLQFQTNGGDDGDDGIIAIDDGVQASTASGGIVVINLLGN